MFQQLYPPYENNALFDLNTLPPDLRRPRRRHFFGYNVTMEWISQYLTEHGVDTSSWTFVETIFRAPGRLRKTLAFGTPLDLQIAFDDGTFPPDVRLMDGDPSPLPLILIVCSYESWVRGQRPSKEALDRLTTAVGDRPRWWADTVSVSWYTGCGE